MKKSEARIIVYLSQVLPHKRNVSTVSSKLDIGYTYLGNLLRDMLNKNWLRKQPLRNKMFYSLTELGRLEILPIAKEELRE